MNIFLQVVAQGRGARSPKRVDAGLEAKNAADAQQYQTSYYSCLFVGLGAGLLYSCTGLFAEEIAELCFMANLRVNVDTVASRFTGILLCNCFKQNSISIQPVHTCTKLL